MQEDTTVAGNGPTWQETPTDTSAGTEPVMFGVAVAPVRRRGSGALRAGIVAGVAALVVLGTAITMAASPAATAPRGLVAVASAAPTENPSASPAPGGDGRQWRGMGGMGGPGMMGGRGGPGAGMLGGAGVAPANGWTFMGGGRVGGPRGGLVGAITIVSINGDSLSLKTGDGWTRTITLTDATKITKAGATIKVTDLATDDTIRFSETGNSDGSYTITAVDVVLPTVVGQVTATTSSSITMTGRDGSTITVHVAASTTYAVDGKTGLALSDIKSGMVLVAEGAKRSDVSLDAARIQAESFSGGGFGGGFRGRGNWNNGASPAPTKAPGSNG